MIAGLRRSTLANFINIWSGVTESNCRLGGRSSLYFPLYERQIVWWAVQESNLHSTNYEFAALTIKLTAQNLVRVEGLEPPRLAAAGFKPAMSTGFIIPALLLFFFFNIIQ